MQVPHHFSAGCFYTRSLLRLQVHMVAKDACHQLMTWQRQEVHDKVAETEETCSEGDAWQAPLTMPSLAASA